MFDTLLLPQPQYTQYTPPRGADSPSIPNLDDAPGLLFVGDAAISGLLSSSFLRHSVRETRLGEAEQELRMINNHLIVHIPDKQPHNLHHQPTESVFASAIDPKHANQIVRRLNQIAPLEDFRHVKRIQKKVLEGGQVQLSVILCLASEGDNQLDSVPPHLQELISSYQSANMLRHQKKSGKNNAKFGQHHITQGLTALMALLDLARRTHSQF